ncbi:hypothetical protein [Zhihengliuella halotolerans]|uniref:MYXO-CTERM domain-containing protein n=1 Tax=Zhihengliuella halotolerans TaxID=370736 RepID=A0A4V2GA52_9MICC|nr:hypothetical protein [Zhihengliuella halotolerans]RZU62876.1 hypothetical protein EV380_2481 [Zhihengliuella halotolerans]
MPHVRRRRRLLTLACLLAAVLVACFSHALSAGGAPSEAPRALAVSQHDGAAHPPLAAPATAGEAGCGHGCSSEASAGALMCAMAATAAIGAIALARPSRSLLPRLRVQAPPRTWWPTPAVPRPPSLAVLCISRT